MGFWNRFDQYGTRADGNVTTIALVAALREQLVKIHGGTGAKLPNVGGALPAMPAAAVVACYAALVDLVRRALEASVTGFDVSSGGDAPPDYAAVYLAATDEASPARGEPWVRKLPDTPGEAPSGLEGLALGLVGVGSVAASLPTIGATIAPIPVDDVHAASIRPLMAAWQEWIEAGGSLLAVDAYAFGLWQDETAIAWFWGAMYKIAREVDSLGDVYVTVAGGDRLLAAAEAAKGASATAAGELLAGAANLAGKTAGQIGAGFLDGIGIVGAGAVAAYFLLR